LARFFISGSANFSSWAFERARRSLEIMTFCSLELVRTTAFQFFMLLLRLKNNRTKDPKKIIKEGKKL